MTHPPLRAQAAMKFAHRALEAIQGSPDDLAELVDATVRAVHGDKEVASLLQVAGAGSRTGGS